MHVDGAPCLVEVFFSHPPLTACLPTAQDLRPAGPVPGRSCARRVLRQASPVTGGWRKPRSLDTQAGSGSQHPSHVPFLLHLLSLQARLAAWHHGPAREDGGLWRKWATWWKLPMPPPLLASRSEWPALASELSIPHSSGRPQGQLFCHGGKLGCKSMVTGAKSLSVQTCDSMPQHAGLAGSIFLCLRDVVVCSAVPFPSPVPAPCASTACPPQSRGWSHEWLPGQCELPIHGCTHLPYSSQLPPRP